MGGPGKPGPKALIPSPPKKPLLPPIVDILRGRVRATPAELELINEDFFNRIDNIRMEKATKALEKLDQQVTDEMLTPGSDLYVKRAEQWFPDDSPEDWNEAISMREAAERWTQTPEFKRMRLLEKLKRRTVAKQLKLLRKEVEPGLARQMERSRVYRALGSPSGPSDTVGSAAEQIIGPHSRSFAKTLRSYDDESLNMLLREAGGSISDSPVWHFTKTYWPGRESESDMLAALRMEKLKRELSPALRIFDQKKIGRRSILKEGVGVMGGRSTALARLGSRISPTVQRVLKAIVSRRFR